MSPFFDDLEAQLHAAAQAEVRELESELRRRRSRRRTTLYSPRFSNDDNRLPRSYHPAHLKLDKRAWRRHLLFRRIS